MASFDPSFPGDGLSALDTLKNGGLAALAGDLAYTEQRMLIKTEFLGREVFWPTAAHRLALLTGAPIITLFSIRLSRGRYHIQASPPRYVKADSSRERRQALENSVKRYTSDLEGMLRQYPFQWAVFDKFFV